MVVVQALAVSWPVKKIEVLLGEEKAIDRGKQFSCAINEDATELPFF